MRQSLHTLLLLSLIMGISTLLTQCASPGSIQGGPKDETPPSVDTLHSTPTPQTNFTPQEIVIAFDEWVKLDDPFSQIFISPPLEQRPEYNLKKKSLVINFHEEEVLQDSTTYIINLGTSVQDITESNPVENFQFVFSTGDWLDSLSFSGVITDALTGEPVENVSVMLYENFADSAIATLPASYFARTNKEGEYHFNYLKADTFQLLGYVDDDLDFRYNEEIEPLGFIPVPISTSDVHDSLLSFTISLGSPPVYLDKVDTSTAGLAVLTFSGPVTDTVNLRVFTDGIQHFDRINNQLRMYYSMDSIPVLVITENKKRLRDTVNILSLEKDPMEPENLQITRVNPTFLPEEFVELMVNWPIQSIDRSKIQLTREGSEELIPLDSMSATFNTVYIKYPWQADSSYQMTLFSEALILQDEVVHDTIEFFIEPVSPESLASLVITLAADSTLVLPAQLILQLKQNDQVIAEKTTAEVNKIITFPALKPGAYVLEIIWDENQNGIWDSARYPGRLPAERIQRVEIEDLRVNWVQEMEIQLVGS